MNSAPQAAAGQGGWKLAWILYGSSPKKVTLTAAARKGGTGMNTFTGGTTRQRRRRLRLGEGVPAFPQPVWRAGLEDLERVLDLDGAPAGGPRPAATSQPRA